MKHGFWLGLLSVFVLAFAAYALADTSSASIHPAGSAAAGASQPAITPEPTRERPYRSYPAPTGAAGFRKYYQKRCYPGCHDYNTPEPTRERLYRSYPAPTGAAGFRKYYQKRCYPGCHEYPAPEPTRERLYRSYPAPTGAAGFRKYYQKRCYPGCHTYGAPASTPVPTRIHP